MTRRKDIYSIYDAELIFKNFEGIQKKFNKKGNRNFCVILSDEQADQLANAGYRIKYLRARDEDEPETPYIKVNVNFEHKAPVCMLIANGVRTFLNEDTIRILDATYPDKVDLSISPYYYTVDGKQGVSAYLNSIYYTISGLEAKYMSLPTSEG